MDKQTFMLFGGFIIAALGFAYIVSERFALKYFYSRSALGVRNFSFLSESTGVFVIRFVLGPILLIMGICLAVAA